MLVAGWIIRWGQISNFAPTFQTCAVYAPHNFLLCSFAFNKHKVSRESRTQTKPGYFAGLLLDLLSPDLDHMYALINDVCLSILRLQEMARARFV